MIDQHKVQLWRGFLLRIVLPSLLAISLFIVAIYVLILPALEQNMLQQKREMIRELTNSSWSILQNYYRQEQDSLVSRKTLQQKALSEIQSIRYGKEQKDYFWINDMRPYMVMHPYTTQLNGKDLSKFQDKEGKKLFIESVQLVQEQGEGFVDYMWQWKDDSTRIVPKLSFVKGFAPWGWVIGTGVYVEDVKEEIAIIEQNLIIISAVIIFLIVILLLIIIIQSIKTESRKNIAEQALRASKEKYKMLIESTSIGTLMVIKGQVVYANKAIIKMLAYSNEDIKQIIFSQLFVNQNDRLVFDDFVKGEKDRIEFETVIEAPKINQLEVKLEASKIVLGKQIAINVNIKDNRDNLKVVKELDEKKEQIRSITEHLDFGIFRVTIGKTIKLLECNPSLIRMLAYNSKSELETINIFDLFYTNKEKKELVNILKTKKRIQNKVIELQKKNGEPMIASISMSLVKDEKGQLTFCDGTIQDITHKQQSDRQREEMIDELQASQFFMYQSIQKFIRPAVKCNIDTSVQEAASIMSKHQSNAIIIESKSKVLGLLTDYDIRYRLVAKGLDLNKPVYEIMTAPLISISDQAFVFEAVSLMHLHDIDHLCVYNNEGKAEHLLYNEDLKALQLQSSLFIIKDIENSTDIEQLVLVRQRLLSMVNSMIKSGTTIKIMTGLMASVFDKILVKVIDLAIAELGKSPVAFSFIALGSEGRGEETLLTDQDNALIYEDVDDEEKAEVEAYFMKLATKINAGLDYIGYKYCIGQVMAQNEKWNQSLSVWKQYFTKWISTSNPQDLLEVSIFFDFRHIYGDIQLSEELRHYINEYASKNERFFIFLAQNMLQYHAPINIFGNIVLKTKGTDFNTFNIKEALIPIVSFARIYAIKYQLKSQNTLERLNELSKKKLISDETFNEISYVYDYLMRLRIQHQQKLIDDKKTPNNNIDPKELTNTNRTTLKKVFNQIQSFQNKLKIDFLGGRGL